MAPAGGRNEAAGWCAGAGEEGAGIFVIDSPVAAADRRTKQLRPPAAILALQRTDPLYNMDPNRIDANAFVECRNLLERDLCDEIAKLQMSDTKTDKISNALEF